MKDLLSTIDGYILEAREVAMVLGAFVVALAGFDLWAIMADKTTQVTDAGVHGLLCLAFGCGILYRGSVAQGDGME